MSQLYNWGYKKEYALLIETLGKTYQRKNNSTCIQKRFSIKPSNKTISIHIRKGDVHMRPVHKNIEYYQLILKMFRIRLTL